MSTNQKLNKINIFPFSISKQRLIRIEIINKTNKNLVSESGSKSYPGSPEHGFGFSSLDDDLALPTMLKMSTKKTFANNNYVKTPSPGSLATGRLSADGSESGQKRSRTQLSQGQVLAMQSTFEMYRSPSLAECEILGNGIGLARRVVQVDRHTISDYTVSEVKL